jgi:hypothetical protein
LLLVRLKPCLIRAKKPSLGSAAGASIEALMAASMGVSALGAITAGATTGASSSAAELGASATGGSAGLGSDFLKNFENIEGKFFGSTGLDTGLTGVGKKPLSYR